MTTKGKKIIRIVIGVAIFAFLLLVVRNYQKQFPRQLADGVATINATPFAWSSVAVVNGRHFTYNTSPQSDLTILVTRLNGTTDEKSSPVVGSVDLGGGIKTLQFKSKIPTTVYVTVK